VPCETCKGELSVPAALLAARAAQREKGAAEGARAATAGSAGATADSSAVKVDAAELERQWHGLSETHGQLLDLFAVDPRSELAPARTAAMQLLDRLHAAGAEDLAGEVAALLDRHQHLRRRWAELREQFEAESQTHATVENVLAGRREALAALPEHRRAQEMQRWNERLDLAIRIYQKNLQPLLDAEADWLGKERQAIDRLWEKLESQGAEAVAAAKAGGEEQKESGKENGRNDAKAAAAVSSNGAAAGAGPQGRTAGPPPKPASTPAAEKPKNGAPAPLPAAEPPHLAAAERNGGAGSTASGPPSKPPAVSARAQERLTPVKRDEPRPAARETEEASGPESRASPDDAGALVKLSPLLWALGGFAAASLVFLLLRRERRKTAVERDAAH
jgi:hypothetical protein